jgi:predicted sugar kinase
MLQLAAPCCLTLAAARHNGRPALLGIALRHPPVQLDARLAPGLSITGARADAAYAHAARLEAHYGAAFGAEVEVELAIPAAMGLGSDALTGLSAARALAALHGLPAEGLAAAAGLAPDNRLAAHAFAEGGLLLVGADGGRLRRHPIPQRDEPRDWVFVFVLPRVPPGTPQDLEDTRRKALWATAEQFDTRAEVVTETLWSAAEHDHFAGFAAALRDLQALGPAPALSPGEEAVLAIMAAGGALAWGRAPTGLALYGLIEGGEPSRALRRELSRHVGHTGGIVMATICDTEGVRLRT